MSKIIVKRQFAVWLEDAWEVDRPSDEELVEFDGDLQAWALENLDRLYEEERTIWTDQYRIDVESMDDEITVKES